MATDKTAVKAYPRKARQPNVLALGLDVSASGGTLESTVLAMLSSARAATQLKTPSTAARSRLKSPSAKSKPPQSLAAPGRATPPEDIDLAKITVSLTYGTHEIWIKRGDKVTEPIQIALSPDSPKEIVLEPGASSH